MDQWLRTLVALADDLDLVLHDCSQSVTVPGHLMLSSDFEEHWAYTWYMHTHAYKINKVKRDKQNLKVNG